MEGKIKSIIEEVLSLKLDQISDLIKHKVDSLDFINILFRLESELGIEISNEEIESNHLFEMSNFIKYLQTNILK